MDPTSIPVLPKGVRNSGLVRETCTIAGAVRSPDLIHEEREVHAQAWRSGTVNL